MSQSYEDYRTERVAAIVADLELAEQQRDEAWHAAELAHNEAEAARRDLIEWIGYWRKAAMSVLRLQDELRAEKEDKKKWLAEYNHYFKKCQGQQHEIEHLKHVIDQLRGDLARARKPRTW